MSPSTIRLLHVEDDPMEQRLLAHHLRALTGYECQITAVASEDEALETFTHQSFDLVVLDYQLEQGDGLNVVQRVRQIDPIVPVIAVSGVATSEIASELVRAGADDYIEKGNLTSSALCASIETALRRADTVRQRTASKQPDVLESGLRHLIQDAANCTLLELGRRLDQAEALARAQGTAARPLLTAWSRACAGQDVRLLRPLLLELLARLFGDTNSSS